MTSQIQHLLHVLSHIPQEFPKVLATCYTDNHSLVAYGRSIYKVNNSVIAGMGLVVATELAKQQEQF
jgi:hypothetical protein